MNLNVARVVEAYQTWSKSEKALFMALAGGQAVTAQPKPRRKYVRKAKAGQAVANVPAEPKKRASKTGNGGDAVGLKFPKEGKRRGRPPGSRNKATMIPVVPEPQAAEV